MIRFYIFSSLSLCLMEKQSSPLPSPRGWKKKNQQKQINVGLGIALEKSTGDDTPANLRCLHRVSPPSSPLPIISPRNSMSEHTPSEVEGQTLTVTITHTLFAGGSSDFQVAGFLRSCHMCDKKLDGVDIYIYRGEKAFCSTECRSWQILTDEYQDSCRLSTEVLRSPEVSNSTSAGDRMFYHGIVAA